MRRDDPGEVPLGLNTAVIYRGKVARVVGRSKPICLPWRYDVLVGASGNVVRGVSAEMLELEGRAAAAD